MTLGIRQAVVLGLVVGVFLTAHALMVANWMAERGVIDFARNIRAEYLTGTAISVSLVLILLLVKPGKAVVSNSGLIRRCPVCDHVLMGRGNYCSECGSKV